MHRAGVQAAAARVAADTRMHVVFEQPELESIRQMRLAELDAGARERREAQRERDAWERDELRDAVPNPEPPERGEDDVRAADPDAPDIDPPDVDR
jgi:hypothetical protein